jgi:hypothetical protein
MSRFVAAAALALAGSAAAAQAPVVSAAPDRVAVTLYRDPGRTPETAPDLEWLEGYALISETRRIVLPAGETEIRFEGVAGGIVPQSAIITGLPDGIVERNRDAWLLSSASLLDRSLGRRVHLRRTARATGAVTEQDAIIRSGAGGAVVLQTREGFEALRCTGQNETLLYDEVPAGLSARPTLSVRARSNAPVTATVTLSLPLERLRLAGQLCRHSVRGREPGRSVRLADARQHGRDQLSQRRHPGRGRAAQPRRPR